MLPPPSLPGFSLDLLAEYLLWNKKKNSFWQEAQAFGWPHSLNQSWTDIVEKNVQQFFCFKSQSFFIANIFLANLPYDVLKIDIYVRTIYRWRHGLRGKGSRILWRQTKAFVLKSVTMGSWGPKLSKIMWHHKWKIPWIHNILYQNPFWGLLTSTLLSKNYSVYHGFGQA